MCNYCYEHTDPMILNADKHVSKDAEELSARHKEIVKKSGLAPKDY